MREVKHWLGRRVSVRGQGAGNLGERLATAAQQAFSEGVASVVLVGSDAPELGGAEVREALGALEQTDIVLGPATDGGYYLIGISAKAATRAIPALLTADIPWSTAAVFEATRVAAAREGLTVHLLEPLSDVDRPDDLAAWQRLCSDDERIHLEPRLSAVIPTLNEEDRIAATVAKRGTRALTRSSSPMDRAPTGPSSAHSRLAPTS